MSEEVLQQRFHQETCLINGCQNAEGEPKYTIIVLDLPGNTSTKKCWAFFEKRWALVFLLEQPNSMLSFDHKENFAILKK